MQSDLGDAMQEQLAIFASSGQALGDAYQQFLNAARRFDFAEAGHYQLVASASLDSTMDAFMACCRLQKQIEGA